MADETTTTSTTEDATTPSTTENVTTSSTTVTSAASQPPVAEKQGEVVIDKGAQAEVLGGTDLQPQEDQLAEARQQALDNHAANQAEQLQSETVTTTNA